LNQIRNTIWLADDPIAPLRNSRLISPEQFAKQIVDGVPIYGTAQQKHQRLVAESIDIAGSHGTNGDAEIPRVQGFILYSFARKGSRAVHDLENCHAGLDPQLGFADVNTL